jgi:Lon protease-like protein
MSDLTQKLPLFPLGSVLFPGATINLHIFEERYRLMIGRCLEESTPFGVLLIREGEEVEEGRADPRPAEPFMVGTTAEISASVKLDDGRILLTAVGGQRFRVEQFEQRVPYLIGAITPLPEQLGPNTALAARDLRLTYERYWQGIAAATGSQAEVEELPQDVVAMTYQLAERLQVNSQRKQRWLEVEVATRLREMTDVLRTELALLPRPGTSRDAGEWSGSLN